MRWVGIDFSGNATMWGPDCGNSNVWIAQLTGTATRPIVQPLDPVQRLPGGGHPFARLGCWLRDQVPTAVGIDAPFSIPHRHLPKRAGRKQLLEEICRLPHDGRPFPKGCHLVAFASEIEPLQQAQPLRQTERAWRVKGINVRSTLWNGRARPGAPFTVACLKFIASTGFPCWPWQAEGQPLLVEAFPAAQLKHWGIRAQGYHHREERREAVLARIGDRVSVPEPYFERARSNADALDAILCAFAAMAVAEGQLACSLPDDTQDEGWIAVHA